MTTTQSLAPCYSPLPVRHLPRLVFNPFHGLGSETSSYGPTQTPRITSEFPAVSKRRRKTKLFKVPRALFSSRSSTSIGIRRVCVPLHLLNHPLSCPPTSSLTSRHFMTCGSPLDGFPPSLERHATCQSRPVVTLSIRIRARTLWSDLALLFVSSPFDMYLAQQAKLAQHGMASHGAGRVYLSIASDFLSSNWEMVVKRHLVCFV